MKTVVKWTIIYCFVVLVVALMVENRDIRILCFVISFWSSMICEFLENKNKRDELQDSKGRGDAEEFH